MATWASPFLSLRDHDAPAVPAKVRTVIEGQNVNPAQCVVLDNEGENPVAKVFIVPPYVDEVPWVAAVHGTTTSVATDSSMADDAPELERAAAGMLWAIRSIGITHEQIQSREGLICLARLTGRRYAERGYLRRSPQTHPAVIASIVSVAPFLDSGKAAATLRSLKFDKQDIELAVQALEAITADEEAMMFFTGENATLARFDLLCDLWFDQRGNRGLIDMASARPREPGERPIPMLTRPQENLVGKLARNGCHRQRALTAVAALESPPDPTCLPESLHRYLGEVETLIQSLGLGVVNDPPQARSLRTSETVPRFQIGWDEVTVRQNRKVTDLPLTFHDDGTVGGASVSGPEPVRRFAESVAEMLNVIRPSRQLLWFGARSRNPMWPGLWWLPVCAERLLSVSGRGPQGAAVGQTIVSLIAGRVVHDKDALNTLEVPPKLQAISIETTNEMRSNLKVFKDPWATLRKSAGDHHGPKYLNALIDSAEYHDNRRAELPGHDKWLTTLHEML